MANLTNELILELEKNVEKLEARLKETSHQEFDHSQRRKLTELNRRIDGLTESVLDYTDYFISD